MTFTWTRTMLRCTACGASWEAPKDEPHECAVIAARSQADALAEALAQVATIAPGGTRWPRFTLPAHHRIYALVRFQDETVFAGGEDVEAARIALRDELLRLASYRSSSSTETEDRA